MTQELTTTTADTPAVIVLGTDALLAARPATPVQLAHACLAAGYRAAFPASWGDELLASTFAARAARRVDEPLIACTCPFVAERFVGSELDGFLLSLTSPPVAAARYLRELYGHVVHITYVGACPSAGDASIDARYAPGEFLARLRELGIEVEEQPVVFESVIPPDRRRFESLPGGVPTNEALRRAGATQKLVELEGEDFVVALAEQLLTREAAFIDVAPRLGCACAGATSAGSLRPAIAALEPPRARAAVVDASVAVDLEPPPPRVDVERPAPREVEPATAPPPPIVEPLAAPPAAAAPEPEPDLTPVALAPAPMPTPAPAPEPEPESPTALVASEPPAPIETVAEREPALPPSMPDESVSRRSPAFGVPRLGVATPVSRTAEGRIVPRAYLRRRRFVPEGPRDEPSVPPSDRQAQIVTHHEPETIHDVPAESPPAHAEAARPIEVEVPLPRTTIPRLTATDVIPPPPIMPDPHFGEAFIVADSLSELIGMEAASAQPLAPPDAVPAPPPIPIPAMPPEPSAARQAPADDTTEVIDASSTVEPAPAPRPAAAPDDTPASPAAASQPATIPVVPLVPPVVPAPPVGDAGHRPLPPLPRATPAMAPRLTRRERTGVILPRRRRGTAVVLWALVVATLALGAIGTKLLIANALASAATPRPDSARSAATPPSAETPVLPPLLIDTLAPRSDSAWAAAPDSSPGVAVPSADTVSPRREPAPPPRADSALSAQRSTPAPARRRQRLTTKPPRPAAGAQRGALHRAGAVAPPHIGIVKDSAARAGSARDSMARDSVYRDSVARDSVTEPPKLSEPRVTRPWPPPALQ